MNTVQRGQVTVPFDEDSNKETDDIVVPQWARSVYVSYPELNSGTLTQEISLDRAVTYGARPFDLDGTANPRTAFTGGSATLELVAWYDVEGTTHMKLVSSVAQTGLSAVVRFKA